MIDKLQTTTCKTCDGSGLIDPMLSAHDPANGLCDACGGKGAVPPTTDAEQCANEARRYAKWAMRE
jgi:DnaJ-class molecular chaperone